MKSYSTLSLYWAVYLMLPGISLAQDPTNLIDLDRVADLLKFPRSELVIIDYLDQEKFIYTKKNISEENSGRMPPVDPASIYQSYWIASKTPNALLPIIVTLSKPDAYLTPKVKKMIEDLTAHAATQRSLGVDFLFGDFKSPEASKAAMFHEEIRVPSHLKVIIEPGDTWTRQDDYPTHHPATVSIARDASSEVDVRIALYNGLYYPHTLVQVQGGEEYFAAFGDEPEDDPKEPSKKPPRETPIFSIFKGLNQIVLTSPIMNPYRKTPVPPVPAPESSKEEEAGKPADRPAAAQAAPARPLRPANETDSSSNPKILALVLLALGLLAAILIKFRRK